MRHMQQDFQILTAEIGGLDEKRKRVSDRKPPEDWWIINSLIAHKVQMK